MTARALLAGLALVTLLTAGCSGGSVSSGAARSTTAGASAGATGGDTMAMDMGAAGKPSEPASMICGAEIRGAVKRTFALPEQPSATPRWSASDRLFTCTYRIGGSPLALAVQDATEAGRGAAYFGRLRDDAAGARPIGGMESFGFPAFETPTGRVAFLKDGKSLEVDASALPATTLPAGYSREEVAYSVASAVIACWTE